MNLKNNKPTQIDAKAPFQPTFGSSREVHGQSFNGISYGHSHSLCGKDCECYPKCQERKPYKKRSVDSVWIIMALIEMRDAAQVRRLMKSAEVKR